VIQLKMLIQWNSKYWDMVRYDLISVFHTHSNYVHIMYRRFWLKIAIFHTQLVLNVPIKADPTFGVCEEKCRMAWLLHAVTIIVYTHNYSSRYHAHIHVYHRNIHL